MSSRHLTTRDSQSPPRFSAGLLYSTQDRLEGEHVATVGACDYDNLSLSQTFGRLR